MTNPYYVLNALIHLSDHYKGKFVKITDLFYYRKWIKTMINKAYIPGVRVFIAEFNPELAYQEIYSPNNSAKVLGKPELMDRFE